MRRPQVVTTARGLLGWEGSSRATIFAVCCSVSTVMLLRHIVLRLLSSLGALPPRAGVMTGDASSSTLFPPCRASALDGVCLPAESSFRWKMVLVGLSLGGSSAVAAPALVGPMLRRLLTWRGARMVLVLPGGAQGGGTRRPGRRCCRGLRRLPSRGAGPWGLRSVNDLRAALRSGGGGAGRCSRLRHFKSRFEWEVGVVTGGGPLAGWLAAAAASVASAAAAAAVTRQRRPAVSAPRAHDVGKFCSRQASQT